MMRKGLRYDNMQGGHAIVRVLFAFFFFLYFSCSQDAAISLAQHRLSGGQTAYHPIIGAGILTLALMCLQSVVGRVTQIPGRLYTLTFIPAVACAVLPIAILPEARVQTLLSAAAGVLVWVAVEAFFFLTRGRQDGASRISVIPNLCISLAMALFLGGVGYSDDVLTFEVKTARLLMKGKEEEALRVGRRSLATSSLLTALRAHAMSGRPGGMGNYLFAYPIPAGGSRNLYLTLADSARTLLPKDSIRMLTQAGLQCLPADTPGASARRAADYHLCGLLLDKRLERFAEDVQRYYAISDSAVLPQYYEQALVLYKRLYASGRSIGHVDSSVMANYMDFKEKGAKYTDAAVRSNYLRREYGDTYWWYYFYH